MLVSVGEMSLSFVCLRQHGLSLLLDDCGMTKLSIRPTMVNTVVFVKGMMSNDVTLLFIIVEF